MIKSNAKMKEIENFEEHGNKLIKQILKESINWTIDDKGNSYQNCKTDEIIHFNNFLSEQNELIKSCLKRKVKLVSLPNFIQLMGRKGKVEDVVWTRIENETDYENRIETPIKKT